MIVDDLPIARHEGTLGRQEPLLRSSQSAKMRIDELSKMMPWKVRKQLHDDLITALDCLPERVRQESLILQLVEERNESNPSLEKMLELRQYPQLERFQRIIEVLQDYDISFLQKNARFTRTTAGHVQKNRDGR
ncbi:MAG: hypothetical protein ABH846_04610 [Patescibacteria group bacterium]